eukprot:IDg10164t1
MDSEMSAKLGYSTNSKTQHGDACHYPTKQTTYGTTPDMLIELGSAPQKAPTDLPSTSATISNIVLGASDGSTVPFALAAGLASTTTKSRHVITGVIAELAAGCIAMGLGGYMAAHAELAYAATKRRLF